MEIQGNIDQTQGYDPSSNQTYSSTQNKRLATQKAIRKKDRKLNFICTITTRYEPIEIPIITAPNMGNFLITRIQHNTKLSIEKIAVLSDIAVSTAYRLVKNQNKYPSFTVLRKLLVTYCLLTGRYGETFKFDEIFTVTTIGICAEGIVHLVANVKWWITKRYPKKSREIKSGNDNKPNN